MKKKTADERIHRSLFSIKSYLIFFTLIGFVVTCSFLIFLNSMHLEREAIEEGAKLTFLNVLFLSFLCCLFDGIRRKYTVERPLRRILTATQQITKGDFHARIEPLHNFKSWNEFDAIIDDFNTMAEELSGIETLRTDFIANVSHELKTPLSIIQNYAAMLQDSTLPEEQRLAYAKTIATATHRLSDLITNILKLNKLENQTIYTDMKDYDLGEQLCECLLAFEDEWEKKELDIITDIDENIHITSDAQLLSLVWNNLFSNAIKFTPEHGTISLSLKEEGQDIFVKVSDTGCGIAPHVGAHIFEKFYQGDTSHAIQGNGLGLALVKRVVDITGGEIRVESTVGKGSTFVVKLKKQSI